MTDGDLPPSRFERRAKEELGFLEAELGFVQEEVSLGAPESWMTFRRSDRRVTVYNELGSGPWIKLSCRREDGRQEGYDLDFFLMERAPERLKEVQRLRSTGRHSEVLALLSECLRTFGKDFLEGDYSIFPKLRKLAENRLKAREQELFGGE